MMGVRWLAPTLVVGGLLSSFWLAPFYLRRAFLNDMGWEKIPYRLPVNENGAASETVFSFSGETIWRYLLPRTGPVPMRPFSDWKKT